MKRWLYAGAISPIQYLLNIYIVICSLNLNIITQIIQTQTKQPRCSLNMQIVEHEILFTNLRQFVLAKISPLNNPYYTLQNPIVLRSFSSQHISRFNSINSPRRRIALEFHVSRASVFACGMPGRSSRDINSTLTISNHTHKVAEFNDYDIWLKQETSSSRSPQSLCTWIEPLIWAVAPIGGLCGAQFLQNWWARWISMSYLKMLVRKMIAWDCLDWT